MVSVSLAIKRITSIIFVLNFFFVNVVSGQKFKINNIEIIYPYINKTFPGAKTVAGYLTIKNFSQNTARLMGISTTLGKAMIHKTMTDNYGVISMKHVTHLDILPAKSLTMQPGSYHIVIQGVSRTLKTGEKISATLYFKNDFKINIKFSIKEKNF